jgi:glycosyl transferase family 87
MSEKLRIAGIAASLAVLTILILLIARPSLDPARIKPLVLVAGAWVAFGCAAWLLRKVTVRLAVGLILAGGIAVQVVALCGPPQNSTDLYRYIWDGRVQAAGIDPYSYAPGAAGVVALRNDFLWSAHGPGHYGWCIKNTKNTTDPADSLVAGCAKLNRPGVPTVYPPVAEGYFFAVQLAAPADDSTTPIQAAAAGLAMLTTVILLFGLRGLGKDPRLAALWAWCPTVALEAGQNGHIDVVAVALTLVALLLLARARTDGRTALGGVLLGLAIATKVTPVLVVPAVLRRGWLLISASAVAAISVVYAPHVMAVGRKIIGFFPGYLTQEGYSNGDGFSVIGLFVHGKLATAAAVVILGVIAMAIIRFGDPDQPWRGGVLMTSAALAVCTPNFQWYAILLVMLVALDGRPEWLAIAAGGYLAGDKHLIIDGIAIHDPRLLGWGGGAAIAGACALVRYLLTRRGGAGVGEPAPAAVAMTTDAVSAGAAATASDTPAAEGAGGARGARSAQDATEPVIEPVEPVIKPAKPIIEPAEPVIEPAAVFAPAVTVTIGADGAPAFATAADSASHE